MDKEEFSCLFLPSTAVTLRLLLSRRAASLSIHQREALQALVGARAERKMPKLAAAQTKSLRLLLRAPGVYEDEWKTLRRVVDEFDAKKRKRDEIAAAKAVQRWKAAIQLKIAKYKERRARHRAYLAECRDLVAAKTTEARMRRLAVKGGVVETEREIS